MTGVFVVRDPDPARRGRAGAQAGELLRHRGATVVGSLERLAVTIVWGTHPAAPVSTAATADRTVLVLGDLLDGGRWRTAGDVAADPDGPLAAADGMHVRVATDGAGRLSIAVDHLGMVPIHHWAEEAVVLVATHPGLLRAHERFVPRLDGPGLAGILLADAPVAGRTAWAGVRRLGPGQALVAEPGSAPVAHRTSRVTPSTALHDAPLGACAAAVDDAHLEALGRHLRADRRHALLLSGGHDSRLMAGLVARAGVAVDAVTLGERRDLEHRAAHRVAAAVGLPHRLLPDPEDERELEGILRWEGLVTTPTVGREVGAVGVAGILSGYAMDNAWADPHLGWLGPDAEGRVGFDAVLRRVNRAGVPLPGLRSLLATSQLGGALDAAVDAARDEYERAGEQDLERVWRTVFEGRGRFWVGGALWRHAATGWPVVPHLDRSVLATATSVPLALLEHRHLQRHLLATRYPALAAIPLDQTSFETTAIAPRPADVLRSVAERRARRLRQGLRLPGREVRRMTRTLDLARPGWTAARQRLEHLRPLAHDVFDPATFDALLPPPGQPLRGPTTYPHSNAAKLLLGVLVLLDDGLAT